MSEGVEILISADDQASAKFAQVAKAAENNVKQIKEVGGKAKASTEFVGQLAGAFGNSQIAGFAGQLAGLTEKVGAFAEVSKAGGAGALLFKAGLAGAAGILAFNVGKALGDVVFETKRWADELENAKNKMADLDKQMLTLQGRKFGQRRELVAAADGENREEVIKAEIQALNVQLMQEQQSLDNANAQLETAKKIKAESWTETPAEMNARLEAANKAVELAKEKIKATLEEKTAYEEMIGAHAQELEAEAQDARKQAETIEAAERQLVDQSWSERVMEAKSRYADFEQVALAPDVPITPAIADMLKHSEKGPDLAYFLGMNKAAAAELAALSKTSPVQAAWALGRLEASISAPTPRMTSQTPDPIAPVRGKAQASLNPDKMSMAEYIAARKAGKI